ncbi:putative late blight resistance proteinR1A-4 [Sesamum alatum]|uniref:Late blight resistance proteinR1A-4 n=1 Tax=Sesamum alatum TaxID=300844 RepID=A0AAE1YNM6_9LAMI|nr:putative late blight resistance proteinR1A-4 [Sesamum alatum]
MAYAALVSVAETLSQILKHHQYGVFLDEKRRFEALCKHVINRSWSSSGGPRSVDLLPHQSGRSNSRRLNPRFRKMCQQLPKVTEAVEYIVEEDFIAIKSRLCGESCKLEFLPIYGMGGIGKTTIGRSAYGDPLIVEHFDIRAWVTVSQDYSTQEMLFTLVDSIKAFNGKFDEEKHSYEKFDGEKHSFGQMSEHVYKSLKGRRYLVVLDDMWSTKAWDDVRRIFPDDSNGSRIIITTRLQDVAAYADSSSPLHEMRFMDVDQSWILLQQKVFNEQHCPPDLENTGKMIARSCKGLPLAIVVIAGILSTVSQTQASWEDIAQKVNSVVNANNEQFAKILSLSYTHLPHHLRPCFLYMGGFPEDYEIHARNLSSYGWLKAL